MKYITFLLSLLVVQAATAQNAADARQVRRLRSAHQILKVEDDAASYSLNERAFAERELLARLLQDGSMSM